MLGSRLRKERTAIGLSQRELAARCGVRVNAQAHYENGDRIPRADYLQALLGMGFDVHYILSGEHAPQCISKLSDDEQRLLKAFRGLRPEDRNAVDQVVRSLTLSVRS